MIRVSQWICGAMVAGVGLSGCATMEHPESAVTGASPEDEVRDSTPFEDHGRFYVARKDGGRIPLLTADEAAPPASSDSDPSELPRYRTVPPPSYDLSSYQTPVKDQLDRGTCATFATIAAIEAAYKRSYGLTLDLSEQYLFHVSKSTTVNYPRIYQYENQSSYWWGGGWPTAQYLLPTETDAPYAGVARCPSGAACTQLSAIPGATSLVWAADPAANHVTQQQIDDFEYSPLHIPPAARLEARYGVASYTNYGTADARNTSLLESLISSNQEVIISVDLKWQMLPGGILDYDATAGDAWHVFVLIGYDRPHGYFLVKNSWGGTAPGAYLRVSYNFLQNTASNAATVNAVVSPFTAPQSKARWIGKWNQDHEGWYGTLVIRRITDPDNAAWRFGTHYLYGSYDLGHSVNGVSIDGDRGLRFYVASEIENAPGTLSGQPFEVDEYDAAPDQAAGTVWWDTSGEGGVHLGRAYLGLPYSNTFSPAEWVGTWDVNSNGYPGTLTITSVTPTSGDYVVNATLLLGGMPRSVSGTLERTRPTIAHFIVDGVWTYTLHYHFWEDRLASGAVTRGGYLRTGVHAVKR